MKVYKYALLVVLSLSLFAFTSLKNNGDPNTKHKCMVQLINYEGEGAYLVVSVVDKDDNYLKTVHVLGNEKKWYHDIKKWWKFHKAMKKPNLDAISGATISGGERAIFSFNLSDEYLKDGNKLRFETAVEHGDYHIKDLEIELTPENLKNKFEGTGYIRYVRIQ